MSPAVRRTVAVAGVAALAAWTLLVLGTWWLLQGLAGVLEGGSPAAALAAFTAWTDRPWVRLWLDPDFAAALRDGLDWLLGLGGGPGVWLGTAMVWLAAALLMVWAGGLVLAVLCLAVGWAVWRRVRGTADVPVAAGSAPAR